MRKIDPSWILQGSSRGDIPNVTPPILLPHQNANQYIAALYYSNQISLLLLDGGISFVGLGCGGGS
jgi:hypothetical protein